MSEKNIAEKAESAFVEGVQGIAHATKAAQEKATEAASALKAKLMGNETEPENKPAILSNKKDYSLDGLGKFKAKNPKPDTMTTSYGVPMSTRTAVLTAGNRGPMLMQDVLYFDELMHFDRERIPERVVHAKGAGAHGYFEVTHDITQYTKACVFSEVGKKTQMFVRFSTVMGERGSADTARDPRGFAMKFYTEEGNWDLVANNTPIFFIRDPMLFPSFIHSQKRNPVTNLKDPNSFWDFPSLRPEAIHQFLFVFSDRGTPDGFRHMDGFGSHTFKFVNKEGQPVYCKFHAKTAQGIRCLSTKEAEQIGGGDPDYATRDLFNAIEGGDFPQWNFYIQVMTLEQADNYPSNPFDLTKVWPHAEFPMIPVGRIVLNKNVSNHFAEVEQVAFSPSNVIAGIEFSPDKMLQGRLMSYKDTQFHRLGTNYQQLPINCPLHSHVSNIQRDGLMALGDNQADAPNHHPNSFNGAQPVGDSVKESTFGVHGFADRYESADEDNYSQPRIFWQKVLDPAHRQRVITNMCDSLALANTDIQERIVKEFSKVHEELGSGLAAELSRRAMVN